LKRVATIQTQPERQASGSQTTRCVNNPGNKQQRFSADLFIIMLAEFAPVQPRLRRRAARG
jgi:hypothetical protein